MGDPMPLPPPPWVLGSSRGTLEPLGYDSNAVVIDRVIELEKSSSALKVGIRVKLTVRLFMFWGVRLFMFFFYLDPSRALRKTFFFRTNIHVPSVVPMQFLHRSVIAPMRRPLNSRRSLRSRTSKTDPLRIEHQSSC